MPAIPPAIRARTNGLSTLNEGKATAIAQGARADFGANKFLWLKEKSILLSVLLHYDHLLDDLDNSAASKKFYV